MLILHKGRFFDSQCFAVHVPVCSRECYLQSWRVRGSSRWGGGKGVEGGVLAYVPLSATTATHFDCQQQFAFGLTIVRLWSFFASALCLSDQEREGDGSGPRSLEGGGPSKFVSSSFSYRDQVCAAGFDLDASRHCFCTLTGRRTWKTIRIKPVIVSVGRKSHRKMMKKQNYSFKGRVEKNGQPTWTAEWKVKSECGGW